MDKFKIGNSTLLTVAFAAAMACVVEESKTIISIALEGAGTLALSADAKPVVGDEVIVKASSDATARALTFGTGFLAPVLAGVISKTNVQSFVYDGTNFIATGAPVQID